MNNNDSTLKKIVRKLANSDLLIAYLFMFPAFIILFTFRIYPAIQLAWLSLRDTLLIRPFDNFIGLTNYSRMLFDDPRFWNALGNTLIFVLLSVPMQMALALLIALGLKRKVKGLAFLRAGYFAPVVVSMVAVAMVFQWLYHPNLGLFNYVIARFGFSPTNWLRNPHSFLTPIWLTIKPWIETIGWDPANWEWLNVSTSMFAVVFVAVWKGTGYYMVIYLAGLMDIPNQLYEAAEVDGANTWQKFKDITWPLLTPTTYLILILQVINSFQVFSSVYIMTGGGPSRKTEVIVYYIYNRAFESLEMGYASAISLFLFAFLLIMTAIQKFGIGGRVHYDR
ncbi:MAG: carbohydrate ABC transporter permease [Bacillota bacterium]